MGYSELFKVTAVQPTLTLEVGLNWDKHNIRAYTVMFTNCKQS